VLAFPLDRDRGRQLRRGDEPSRAAFPVTRHRWEGFADAWATLGGDLGGLRVAVSPHNSTAEGEALAHELLAGAQPPDAIAAMSDELALGALRAAEREGIPVPAALAITGWDDSEAAAARGLTTVAQSLHDQGIRCAELALGKAGPDADDADAPWRVVRRRSTRDPIQSSGGV
jgi:DNA-binding LacI/PurR family transcriptional regulator